MELADSICEGFALDEAHGVVGPAVAVLAQAVDRHDAGMFESPSNLCFLHKSSETIAVGFELRPDFLKRDFTVQLFVERDEHLADAALRMQANDFVARSKDTERRQVSPTAAGLLDCG